MDQKRPPKEKAWKLTMDAERKAQLVGHTTEARKEGKRIRTISSEEIHHKKETARLSADVQKQKEFLGSG